MSETRKASCHCGAVELEVELPDGASLSVADRA